MKKIVPYVSLCLMIMCVVLLGACGRVSAKSGSLEFFYEKNSAQKVLEGNKSYVKMMIEIKNNDERDASVLAEDFYLLAEGEKASEDVYFGNNIVDKMDKEVIEPAHSVSLVLSIGVGEQSSFDLYYGNEYLLSFSV